jgi:hypothetical protein
VGGVDLQRARPFAKQDVVGACFSFHVKIGNAFIGIGHSVLFILLDRKGLCLVRR